MKRPLLPPALSFALGITAGWFQPASLPFLFTALSILLVAAISIAKWRSLLLLPLFFVAGWTHLGSTTQVVSPHDIRLLVSEHPRLLSVRGTLAESPLLRVSDDERNENPRWRTQVRLDEIRTGETFAPARGTIIMFTPGHPPTNLFVGSRVEVYGILRQPDPASFQGLFDYREKLRRQGVYFQLETEGGSDWKIVSQPKRKPLHESFRAWARSRFAEGLPGEDRSLRLLWAMVLGWRTALTDEVAEPFMRSGTMHIFAISGLHIALISGILVALLRVMQIRRAICGFIVVPALWFYCAATGWQASATRATLMMTIIVGGWALKRPGDLLNSICFAALIILAWNPLQLLQASFQLSFSVVSTIALLLPRFDPLKEQLFQTDPFLPAELVPKWKRSAIWLGRAAFTALALSLTAWLGSLPLIAHYFHLFTPGSLLANPFIVLFAMLAIMSALGGLVTAILLPPVAVLFNHSAWLWVTCQVWISEHVSKLPGSWWHVRSPEPWELMLYYTVLIFLALPWFWKPHRRWYSTTFIVAAACAWMGTTSDGVKNTRISILPDGANAIHVDQPGHENDLLIDCGRTRAYRFVVKPFLQSRGVNRLAHVALTHGDIAHVEAFPDLDADFQPTHVATSGASQRSTIYRKIIESLQTQPRHETLTSGNTLAGWKILHPAPDKSYSRADDSVLVFAAELHGVRVLIAPDLGEQAQTDLLESGAKLDADILICGLPTDGQPPRYEFIKAVSPDVIIVQDNRLPFPDRAKPEAKNRLYRTGISTLFSSEQKGMLIRINPDKWEILGPDKKPLQRAR